MQWRLSAWPCLQCFKGRQLNEWQALPQMLPGFCDGLSSLCCFSPFLSPVAFPPCPSYQWLFCSLSLGVMLYHFTSATTGTPRRTKSRAKAFFYILHLTLRRVVHLWELSLCVCMHTDTFCHFLNPLLHPTILLPLHQEAFVLQTHFVL